MCYNIGNFFGGIIVVLEYIEGYKREIEHSIEDLKRKNTFHKQIPNLLTFIRLIGAIPAGIMYYVNLKLFVSSISFLWFTDAIDGRIAKKLNAQSKLGADMDALADKIMFLGSSIPLLGSVPVLIFNFMMEGVISGINVFGRMKGLNTKTVLSGKIKTVSLALTLISGYLVQFFGMSVSILNLLIVLTSLLQIVSIKDYILEFKRLNNNLKNSLNNDNKVFDGNDISLQEVDKHEKVLEKKDTRDLIDDLEKEREFYLGFNDLDIVKDNIKVRK